MTLLCLHKLFCSTSDLCILLMYSLCNYCSTCDLLALYQWTSGVLLVTTTSLILSNSTICDLLGHYECTISISELFYWHTTVVGRLNCSWSIVSVFAINSVRFNDSIAITMLSYVFAQNVGQRDKISIKYSKTSKSSWF